MKRMKAFTIAAIIFLLFIAAYSCEKYDDYENMEVVENTYYRFLSKVIEYRVEFRPN